jgi:hypothetical protein
MRLRTCTLLLGSALAASLGCRPPQAVVTPATGLNPSPGQQMAALAFISYLGEDVTGSDDDVERKLYPCLQSELARQPITQGRWALAWGPAVYKFAIGDLDDNMMYVVRDQENAGHLAIAVRGTNAKSILDWLVEDFDVDDQVSWDYGNPPEEAKISKGTSEGLKILQTMTAASGPVPDQILSEFLAGEVKNNPSPKLEIDVVGHSLGGALAPALALWLADTQSTWDPAGKAEIGVYALAGPTPGNTEFASYYASRIGERTDRIHNPYDIVPLAWNDQTMKTMADLYEPVTRADRIERELIDNLKNLVKDKSYSQINPGAPPLPGALNTKESTFLDEAGWQHVCGYHCALGLVGPNFPPVTESCPPSTDRQHKPKKPCTVCPQVVKSPS